MPLAHSTGYKAPRIPFSFPSMLALPLLPRERIVERKRKEERERRIERKKRNERLRINQDLFFIAGRRRSHDGENVAEVKPVDLIAESAVSREYNLRFTRN